MTDEEALGTAAEKADWPPEHFRAKTGPYAAWALPPAEREADEDHKAIVEGRRIVPEVAPAGEDVVIFGDISVSGGSMHVFFTFVNDPSSSSSRSPT